MPSSSAVPSRVTALLAGFLVAGLALPGLGIAQDAPREPAPAAAPAATPAAPLKLDGSPPRPESLECQWAGERILSLLWRDDIRTATDFFNLYDRFGCPKERVPLAFRCLVNIGVVSEQGDPTLPQRTRACWADPAVDPATLRQAAAPAAGDQPEGEAPAEGGDAAPQDGSQKPPATPSNP